MPAAYKFKGVAIALLVLIALFGSRYFAVQHRDASDDSETIIDEAVATANGFEVRLVHPDAPEKGVVFFLADNAAPNITTAYAQKIAELSYTVVVVDTKALLQPAASSASQCLDLAARLLDIQAGLGKKLAREADNLPILVGENEGASAVYSILAQAKSRSYHAALSINFTGRLHSASPLCAGDEFVKSDAAPVLSLAPIGHLSSSWYVIQPNSATAPLDIHAFAARIANAKVISAEPGEPVIPEVLQILQWMDPRLSDQLASGDSEGGLPLIEVTAHADPANQLLAVLLTGDGGWAEIDKGIAASLAENGIPTVALDSLSYFWKRKTPDEATRAIESTITDYLAKWHKQRVILIGYSFGADVLPFIANRIDAARQKDIALIALLGVGNSAAFEFHLSSWLDADRSAGRLPLRPEIQKMNWANSICIYGVADKDTDCVALGKLGVKVIGVEGDHHFAEKYGDLVQHLLDNVGGS
jgi:type IV secretory pathway VirJ component